MIKWNLINNEYYRGKLYCIYFKVTPTNDKYIVNAKNSKTKESVNSKSDFNIEFDTLDEAYDWCEKYARVTYFKVYDQYKDWKENRPVDDNEWNNCKKRYNEWLPEFKINFKSLDLSIYDQDKIKAKKILNAYEQLLSISYKKYESYEAHYFNTKDKNFIKLMAEELDTIEQYELKIKELMISFE